VRPLVVCVSLSVLFQAPPVGAENLCWESLAPSTEMGDEVASTELTIAARRGQLWRAWVHSKTGLHVQQRKAGNWRDVPVPKAKVRDPLLRIANDGSVFFSWTEIVDSASAVLVARWTGDGWQRLGAPLSGMPGPFTNAGYADVAPERTSGQPVEALTHLDATYRIFANHARSRYASRPPAPD
jgi:hypothetical protein